MISEEKSEHKRTVPLSFGKKRRQERRIRRISKMQEDLSLYGSRILDSDEMHHAFKQKHHTVSTVGDHTMRVARKSLRMCYLLKKMNVSTDIPAVVTSALCHDLGILGRGEKYNSNLECSRQHPVDSVEVAQKIVGELPDKTTDIISRHMWPIGRSKPPNSLEAAIVSAADKVAAVEDFVIGVKDKIRKDYNYGSKEGKYQGGEETDQK